MLTGLCQKSVEGDEDDIVLYELVTAPTMRIALATVILLATVANLLMVTCMFKEIPNERRKEYQ